MYRTSNRINRYAESEPRQIAGAFPQAQETKPSADNIKRFRSRWETLASEDESESLLAQYGFSPIEALKLLGDTWTTRVPVEALLSRLELLAKLGLNCTITTSNTIATTCYEGKIESVLERNNRLILVSHRARLQFDTAKIASAWLVKKPIGHWGITSLQLLSDTGDELVSIVGGCDRNQDELEIWEDIIRTMPVVAEEAHGEPESERKRPWDRRSPMQTGLA